MRLPRLLAIAASLMAAPAVGHESEDIVWSSWLADEEAWRIELVEPARLEPDPAGSLRLLEPARREDRAVQPIPAVAEPLQRPGRVVQYDVPLSDTATHDAFAARGVKGELIAHRRKAGIGADSDAEKYSARLVAFFAGDYLSGDNGSVQLVRYHAPAEDIALNAEFAHLGGRIIDRRLLRLPEVRFFQPKARVYLDLKRRNDDEFDLFTDGSILASLDVVEFYFPMPLVSERFARTFGGSSRLSGLGWRVGGTIGLGITTALTEGDSQASGAAMTTASAGLRYEFPLGRPSQEVLETSDMRLDQRTRVGVEAGVQGGLSTDESIADATDLGLYFGVLVNTPWGG